MKRFWLHIIFSIAFLGAISDVFADTKSYEKIENRARVGNSKSTAPKSNLKNSNSVKSKKKLKSPVKNTQHKRLSPGEIKKIKNAGYDIHKTKKPGGKSCGKVDLYKDNKGEIFTKPKNGSGPGEPTGYNINNL